MGGYVEELCEVYDPCPVGLLKRLANETFEVDHLAVSWIAATTPDSLNKCEANERVATGFLPRWNIVFGGPPATLIHFRVPKHQTYFDDFVKKLSGLFPKKSYEIKFSDNAITVHKEWYSHHRRRVQDSSIGYFQIRILEVVKKYAVLLAFLNGREDVSKDDMMLAVKFGDYFFSTATRLMTKEIAENKFEHMLQRILRAIRRLKAKGKKTCQRNLMRNISLSKRHFLLCMETLEARGHVKHNKDETWDVVEENADKVLTKD